MTIESAERAINAAPSPCNALAAISISFDDAIPARTDDAIRTRKPATKTSSGQRYLIAFHQLITLYQKL
jgi:hypothetical protein